MIDEHTQNNSIYPRLYRSYWHCRFSTGKENTDSISYFSSNHNHRSGIGNRLSNWIAGYGAPNSLD